MRISNLIDHSPLPDRPLVSIIVPSYNQSKYIHETLRSLLDQSYRPLEVLVIDGGSNDDTVEILQSYSDIPEVIWTSEKDSGVVEAVNKGFDRAKGQILAIQSSDDKYAENGVITNAVEAFRSDERIGLVYGDIKKTDAEGSELFKTDFECFSLENLLCKRTRIPQESAFFRQDLLTLVGGWREEVSYAADTDLFLRMAFRTKALKVNSVFGIRRMHGGQRDQQSRKIVKDYMRMIDTNEDIINGPRFLKRAAKAGKYLTAFRYNPRNSEWLRTYYLYRAKMAYPKVFFLNEVDWRYLIPGYIDLLKILSVIKRKLLNA